MLPKRRQVTAEEKTSDTHKNKGLPQGIGKDRYKENAATNHPHSHNNDDDNDANDAIILHVEIKFAEVGDRSYVNMVVWRPMPDAQGLCHQVMNYLAALLSYHPSIVTLVLPHYCIIP